MPERSGGWRPQGWYSLFVCDVASFGHPARGDHDRDAVRTALYVGLRRSFDDEGIPFRSCYLEDCGDGALLIPPLNDTSVLLTTLIDRLRAEVRRHNLVSVLTARLQLRVAVHTGVVDSDGEGLAGTALIYAFRLLEAEQLKLSLRETGADLALIVSNQVYDDWIGPGKGLIDPNDYHQVVVDVKETVAPAWIRVPGFGPPLPAIASMPVTAPVATPVTVIDARVALPRPTIPDPPTLPALPPPVGLAAAPPDFDIVVDLALDIRQLRVRNLRDQIVADLPLALTTAIGTRRAEGDRADLAAIIRTCRAHPQGLRNLLRVVRQFVGNSAQVNALDRAIEALERP